MVVRAAWLLFLLALPSVAGAQCDPVDCVTVEPTSSEPWIRGTAELSRADIRVEAVEAAMDIQVHLELRNPTARTQQVTVAVPLPPHAVLVGFSTTVDGRVAKGDVQPRGILVAPAKPPVHASLASTDDQLAVKLELGAAVEASVDVQAIAITPMAFGARVMEVPLAGLGDVGRLNLTVAVESRHGVRDVKLYGLQMIQGLDHPLRQEFRRIVEGEVPDLRVVWEEGPGDLLVSLLCSAPAYGGYQEGVFFLQARGNRSFERDVVFVIDRSGSMGNHDKMEAAREALDQGIATLPGTDRFAVVSFDTDSVPLHKDLVRAVPEQIAAARHNVSTIEPGGSTNLDDALRDAFALLGDGPRARVADIVLLTDGMPSAGETDHKKILDHVRTANRRGARIHVAAIGIDADAAFLKDIATTTDGTFVPFNSTDDALGERLGAFIERLGGALVRDVTMGVQGFRHSGRMPGPPRTLRVNTTISVAFGDDWPKDNVLNMTIRGQRPDRPILEWRSFGPRECRVLEDVESLSAFIHVQDLMPRRNNATVAKDIARIGAERHLDTPYTEWVLDGKPAPIPPPPVAESDALTNNTTNSTSEDQHGGGAAGNKAPAAGVGLALALLVVARRRRDVVEKR